MGATSLTMKNGCSLKYLFNQSAQGIAGVNIFPMQATIFDLGDSFGSTVDVNISGPDYEKVRAAAGMPQGMIMQKMNTFAIPNPQNFNIGRAETRVTPTAAPRPRGLDGIDPPHRGGRGRWRDHRRLPRRGQEHRPDRDEQHRLVRRWGTSAYADALADVPLATRTGKSSRSRGHATRLHRSPAAHPPHRGTARGHAVDADPVEPDRAGAQTAVFEGVIEPLRQQGVITSDMIVRATGSADKLDNFMAAFVPTSRASATRFCRKSGVPLGVFGLAALLTYLILARCSGAGCTRS